MDTVLKYIFIIATIFNNFKINNADTYSLKIKGNDYVNEVDTRFLSFTVDPKYLFDKSLKYQSKESICMASVLTPAYIRIAGPSTRHMTFQNTTITITETKKSNQKYHFTSLFKRSPRNNSFSVTFKRLKKFVQWAKKTEFDLVFALNNEEGIEGVWDTNSTFKILSVAEKAQVKDIYWQLGYECRNQTIEEYLNDLDTLRMAAESFNQSWKVVGGDVTNCLKSRSDFKDYVTLSIEMMDAVLLNSNSSSVELSKLSENERNKLLHLLSQSTTPLWLTEPLDTSSELNRAADWMISLGFAAKNGFAVHFRELLEDELYEPTLSFYMALLYKNLVGERVLDIDMESDRTFLFCHCTSLRHNTIPGAVTLYGVNMDVEPSRFSIKLPQTEGGDIMQYILSRDDNGNIIVNGRTMFYEGDIKPVVKRVRPYKTLLLNLPPKSFGFWVLANSKISTCHEKQPNDIKHGTENNSKEDVENFKYSIKTKQVNEFEPTDIFDVSSDLNDNTEEVITEQDLKEPSRKLNSFHDTFKMKHESSAASSRAKRQIQENNTKRKDRKQVLKALITKVRSFREDPNSKKDLLKKLFRSTNLHFPRSYMEDRGRKIKNRISKRHSDLFEKNKICSPNEIKEAHNRRRRSILRERNEYESSENSIDSELWDRLKIKKILVNINKELSHLPAPMNDKVKHDIPVNIDEEVNEIDDDEEKENIIEQKKNTKKHSIVKSTLDSLVTVIRDLNKNFNRIWGALGIID